MKIANKIDDSFGTGTRIIYVVELASNIFVDVMVINEDIHSKNYAYIMDFDGGQAYVKTDNGDKGVDYQFDTDEVLDFVDKSINEWFEGGNYMEFSVTFVDKDGFYNHKLVVANNVDEVQKYMEDLGYTDIKIEKR